MNLDPKEQKVVEALRSQNEGRIWASRPWVERHCGVEPFSLTRVLARLGKRGVLKKKVLSDHGVFYGIAGLAPETPEALHMFEFVMMAKDHGKFVGVRGKDHRMGWGL